MDTASDDLLARIAAGDREAFAAFYDLHAPVLFGFCVRLLEDAGDAEDVLRETFVQAWRDVGRFDASRASVRGWLFTIARSRALDRRRSRRPLEASVSVADPPVLERAADARDTAEEAELDAAGTGARIEPPAEVRDRVLWGIRGPGAEAAARAIAAAGPDRGLTTMFWALGIAASFMLAAAFAALWYATRADHAATRENVARLEAMVKERDRQIALTSQEVSWLKDSRVQIALLKGLEGSPDARAKLLWNPGTRQGILWVSGMPPLPPEKSYELWAFVGDQPVPAGTFDAKSDAVTVVPIPRQESLGEAPVKFAVSVEPKGGVPAPTGAIVLAGERF